MGQWLLLVLMFVVYSVDSLSRALQSIHQNLTLAMDHPSLDHTALTHPEIWKHGKVHSIVVTWGGGEK